ncbi:MAG: restriction endonuclease [Candidatus Aenigmatarchaeota archaeon]
MEALKKYLENKSWKDFESFIAEVFEIYNFKVSRNVRIKYLKNIEFDIIAEKRNLIVLVECKKWKKIYSNEKNLNKVLKKFKEKIEKFKKYTFKKVVSLIIFLDTKFEPKIIDEIFVMSIDYLNSFLNTIETLI